MGAPWREAGICLGISVVCGMVLGFSVRPCSASARRLRYLSPFVPAVFLTVGVIIDAYRHNFSFIRAIGIVIAFPFLYYLLMLPTAAFFMVTHWFRQRLTCTPRT